MSRSLSYEYKSLTFDKSKLHLHSDVNKIRNTVLQWVLHFKLWDEDRYKREDHIWLACGAYPRGDYQRTLIIAKWVTHLFYLDDMVVIGREGPFFRSLVNYGNSIENLSKVLDKAADYKECTISLAFADIWKQMKALTNEAWQNRFALNYIWYLKSLKWELANNAAKRVPRIAEHNELRHFAGCVCAGLSLIEFSLGIFLPDEIMANPIIARLEFLASHIITFCNDIYSFEKEKRDGEINNLVIALKHELDISYQEALDKAFKFVQNEVDEYSILEPYIPSFGDRDKDVRNYLQGHKDWIAANHDWSLSTQRYIFQSYKEDDF